MEQNTRHWPMLPANTSSISSLVILAHVYSSARVHGMGSILPLLGPFQVIFGADWPLVIGFEGPRKVAGRPSCWDASRSSQQLVLGIEEKSATFVMPTPKTVDGRPIRRAQARGDEVHHLICLSGQDYNNGGESPAVGS